MPARTERELIDEVEQRLIKRFAQVPAARVGAAVDQAHARFADSTIRDFIPLLVERRVADELSGTSDRELAHSR
ncbi:three-helix bundle dimerization domain-containing protein [Mycolicibacterium sp. F2034L]|uniref:three-helix bundle dimerization domain-containing protein n=1 Tax=Mycolicibacterium sp. F2034L TaxID=2926422 RepID=UPI001FF3C5AD|nr:hypothetical protein [Mycolicibacterium sp. F2034L]MCK0176397.1 hypothetical protein [Mycolicibacterium sp. F2034L]